MCANHGQPSRRRRQIMQSNNGNGTREIWLMSKGALIFVSSARQAAAQQIINSQWRHPGAQRRKAITVSILFTLLVTLQASFV